MTDNEQREPILMLTPEQALNEVNRLEREVSRLYDTICDPGHPILRHYSTEELRQLVGSVGISIEELSEELRALSADLDRIGFTEAGMRAQLTDDHENALKLWMGGSGKHGPADE